MIIKSFTAPTAAAALKMVRTKMGGEAVVLRTRVLQPEETGMAGELVEVTACIDEGVVSPGKIDDILTPPEKKATRPTIEEPAKPMKEEPSDRTEEVRSAAMKAAEVINNDVRKSLSPEPKTTFESDLQPIYLDLLDADLPAEYARQLIKEIEQRRIPGSELDVTAHEVLSESFAELIGAEPEYESGMRILFVGPSGSGKTSALAKLAAELVAKKRLKVRLSSLDDIKVSAFEEIGSYADILDIPLDEYEKLAGSRDKKSLTLIDAPAIPFDNRGRLDLVKKIRTVHPDLIFMLFSAGARTRDLMDNLTLFESFSATNLIASHLDESSRWGGLIAMARYLEIPLTYVMDAPGGIGRLKKASANEITRQILKVEEAIYE